MANFYVYMLLRDDLRTPFYVGKGQKNRDKSHVRRLGTSSRKDRIIRKIIDAGLEVSSIRVAVGLTEANAFDLERSLIKAYGRYDLGHGPLANLTDGGDGACGVITSQAVRDIRSKQTKERWDTPGYKEQWSIKMTGRTLSEDHRAATSKGKTGVKFTETHVNNMRLARLGKPQSVAHKQAISNALKGKKKSAEHAAAIGKAKIGNTYGCSKLSSQAQIDAREKRRAERAQ